MSMTVSPYPTGCPGIRSSGSKVIVRCLEPFHECFPKTPLKTWIDVPAHPYANAYPNAFSQPPLPRIRWSRPFLPLTEFIPRSPRAPTDLVPGPLGEGGVRVPGVPHRLVRGDLRRGSGGSL